MEGRPRPVSTVGVPPLIIRIRRVVISNTHFDKPSAKRRHTMDLMVTIVKLIACRTKVMEVGTPYSTNLFSEIFKIIFSGVVLGGAILFGDYLGVMLLGFLSGFQGEYYSTSKRKNNKSCIFYYSK